MTFSTQTIKDAHGNPIAVQIPYAEWKAFEEKKLAQQTARNARRKLGKLQRNEENSPEFKQALNNYCQQLVDDPENKLSGPFKNMDDFFRALNSDMD